MKIAKFAALGLAAVFTLAGCAATPSDPGYLALPITGGYNFTAADFAVRDSLIEQYLAGADHTPIVAALATECYNLATREGVQDGDRWLLVCENPDYVWNAETGAWAFGQ